MLPLTLRSGDLRRGPEAGTCGGHASRSPNWEGRASATRLAYNSRHVRTHCRQPAVDFRCLRLPDPAPIGRARGGRSTGARTLWITPASGRGLSAAGTTGGGPDKTDPGSTRPGSRHDARADRAGRIHGCRESGAALCAARAVPASRLGAAIRHAVHAGRRQGGFLSRGRPCPGTPAHLAGEGAGRCAAGRSTGISGRSTGTAPPNGW